MHGAIWCGRKHLDPALDLLDPCLSFLLVHCSADASDDAADDAQGDQHCENSADELSTLITSTVVMMMGLSVCVPTAVAATMVMMVMVNLLSTTVATIATVAAVTTCVHGMMTAWFWLIGPAAHLSV